MDGHATYDEAVRRRAAALFDEGLGYRAAAGLLGIPRETVRKWPDIYRSVGIEVLAMMGKKHAAYPFGTKPGAVRAVVDGGMTRPEATARFGIASPSSFKRWLKAYREGGPGALGPKPRGRPRGSGSPPGEATREQELERRVRKLEAEDAYLKKSIALKAEKRSRTARKSRP
ncbi:MAG: helix-turn-helix domain-containing protein [Collinsella sp.]|nr:helix-turn-helix domain-containing protein [Collinsella sp.]